MSTRTWQFTEKVWRAQPQTPTATSQPERLPRPTELLQQIVRVSLLGIIYLIEGTFGNMARWILCDLWGCKLCDSITWSLCLYSFAREP